MSGRAELLAIFGAAWLFAQVASWNEWVAFGIATVLLVLSLVLFLLNHRKYRTDQGAR